eukprot:CAMPEP_0180653232 /NCGR_PEP_ID=MMETSP1037_2-20121125/53961_1 /TAXON_ID=632150 /ORGANISM="Azadinium spinosum, Strain 3D9" /LENGTH=225 /DNA_ID=CAMNT_0022679239 /DNA_START=31 /DNA_END=710 /DNA_ORIENTATION=-
MAGLPSGFVLALCNWKKTSSSALGWSSSSASRPPKWTERGSSDFEVGVRAPLLVASPRGPQPSQNLKASPTDDGWEQRDPDFAEHARTHSTFSGANARAHLPCGAMTLTDAAMAFPLSCGAPNEELASTHASSTPRGSRTRHRGLLMSSCLSTVARSAALPNDLGLPLMAGSLPTALRALPMNSGVSATTATAGLESLELCPSPSVLVLLALVLACCCDRTTGGV